MRYCVLPHRHRLPPSTTLVNRIGLPVDPVSNSCTENISEKSVNSVISVNPFASPPPPHGREGALASHRRPQTAAHATPNANPQQPREAPFGARLDRSIPHV